jgi:hypothetical protein
MAFSLRSIVRVAVLAFVGCAAISPTPAQVNTTESQMESVTLLPEVRLRKLHLVRPDLIQYPLIVEVLC